MAAGMPRNFKLLDELEDAERSQEGGADISLGEYSTPHTGSLAILRRVGNGLLGHRRP